MKYKHNTLKPQKWLVEHKVMKNFLLDDSRAYKNFLMIGRSNNLEECVQARIDSITTSDLIEFMKLNHENFGLKYTPVFTGSPGLLTIYPICSTGDSLILENINKVLCDGKIQIKQTINVKLSNNKDFTLYSFGENLDFSKEAMLKCINRHPIYDGSTYLYDIMSIYEEDEEWLNNWMKRLGETK